MIITQVLVQLQFHWTEVQQVTFEAVKMSWSWTSVCRNVAHRVWAVQKQTINRLLITYKGSVCSSSLRLQDVKQFRRQRCWRADILMFASVCRLLSFGPFLHLRPLSQTFLKFRKVKLVTFRHVKLHSCSTDSFSWHTGTCMKCSLSDWGYVGRLNILLWAVTWIFCSIIKIWIRKLNAKDLNIKMYTICSCSFFPSSYYFPT